MRVFLLDYAYLPVISSSLVALWNTKAGGNGTSSVEGTGTGSFYPGETPAQAFDRNATTRYTNHGSCNWAAYDLDCGEDTGLHLTLLQGPAVLRAFRFMKEAANFPNRDPMTVTIEGSNQTGAALMLGSAWTLLYNGSSGITANSTRGTYGLTKELFNNTMAYSRYRVLVTSKRANQTCTSYSELELLG